MRVRCAPLTAAALFLGAMACTDDTTLSPAAEPVAVVSPVAPPPRVLLYGKETEWFHASNPVAAQVMTDHGRARGWTVTTTKESTVFTPQGLAAFDVVVFLISSGKTLDQAQRDAFAAYIAAGHGWVGAHAASHTDYDSVFVNELVGANFCCHGPTMEADVLVQAPQDPIVAHLPPKWRRADEWYTFDRRPEENPRIKVLLAMDEESAGPNFPGPGLPATLRVGFHPIAWKHVFGTTRAFYTGMGHTVESWQDEPFVTMMVNAVEWAAGRGE